MKGGVEKGKCVVIWGFRGLEDGVCIRKVGVGVGGALMSFLVVFASLLSSLLVMLSL